MLIGVSGDGAYARLRIRPVERILATTPVHGLVRRKKLERLAAVAEREWSGSAPALMQISGRPWPITLLVAALALDLLLGVQRMVRALAGLYSWLPMLPTPVSIGLHAAYLVLVAATIHQLWRSTRAGYVLAVARGGAQVARLLVFISPGVSALFVAEALLFPALIAVCLWLVYHAKPIGPAPRRR